MENLRRLARASPQRSEPDNSRTSCRHPELAATDRVPCEAELAPASMGVHGTRLYTNTISAKSFFSRSPGSGVNSNNCRRRAFAPSASNMRFIIGVHSLPSRRKHLQKEVIIANDNEVTGICGPGESVRREVAQNATPLRLPSGCN